LVYNAAPSTVFLMTGGFYTDCVEGKTNIIYSLINENELLLASETLDYLLTAVKISP